MKIVSFDIDREAVLYLLVVKNGTWCFCCLSTCKYYHLQLVGTVIKSSLLIELSSLGQQSIHTV